MQWLTTAMATNIAYGSCTLLLGLLVLSVRQRKLVSKVPYPFYATPGAPARKAVAIRNSKSEQIVRRIMTQPKATVAPIKIKIDLATIEQPTLIAHEKEPVVAPVPSITPAVQISDEVEMNSPSFPFESLDPIALANLSKIGKETNRPAIPELQISPLYAYGLIELEEPGSREFASDAAQGMQMEEAKSSAAAVHAYEGAAEMVAPEEDVFFPLSESGNAPAEKTAGANLLSFYGLTQQPFDVTPDPSFLYPSSSHTDALTSLKQGIEHFRGFMMLVAEPGMGKTTLLHKLMEELNEFARVVFLFQTQCTSRELLCYILNELQVDHTGMDAVAMHRALNQALLEEMLRGRRFVLIVDEAQNLEEPVLETIRLLSDFETTHSKLIQIVLAGQPQLAETLMRESLVQLRQRIAVLSSLKSLSVAETAQYVEYRLRASDWRGAEIFTKEALGQIAESSGGVPRSINNYCFAALLKAFQKGLRTVDASIVREVAGTLNLESLVRRPQSTPNVVESTSAMDAILAEIFEESTVDIPNPETQEKVNGAAFIGPLPNPEVILAGNLTEKVRSQGWSKRHEYRILVTLERDLVSGLPIADRYYCSSLYVDESQAAMLAPGKPVRIKIEQD